MNVACPPVGGVGGGAIRFGCSEIHEVKLCVTMTTTYCSA